MVSNPPASEPMADAGTGGATSRSSSARGRHFTAGFPWIASRPARTAAWLPAYGRCGCSNNRAGRSCAWEMMQHDQRHPLSRGRCIVYHPDHGAGAKHQDQACPMYRMHDGHMDIRPNRRFERAALMTQHFHPVWPACQSFDSSWFSPMVHAVGIQGCAVAGCRWL
jgi:hypothetical protein